MKFAAELHPEISSNQMQFFSWNKKERVRIIIFLLNLNFLFGYPSRVSTPSGYQLEHRLSHNTGRVSRGPGIKGASWRQDRLGAGVGCQVSGRPHPEALAAGRAAWLPPDRSGWALTGPPWPGRRGWKDFLFFYFFI
jgi:hypothetical protein